MKTSLLRKFHDLPSATKEKFALTANHAHIYTASSACLEDNLELKMYVQYISIVEIKCKICKNFKWFHVLQVTPPELKMLLHVYQPCKEFIKAENHFSAESMVILWPKVMKDNFCKS